MKLDQTFLNSGVENAIRSVWQEIASDALEADSRMKNAEAIETILDADRLETFGHPEAAKAIEEADKEHGCTKVGKFLAKNIRLV